MVGGVTGGPDPPGNHKAVAFLRNTGMNPLETHKATQPESICWGIILPPAFCRRPALFTGYMYS